MWGRFISHPLWQGLIGILLSWKFDICSVQLVITLELVLWYSLLLIRYLYGIGVSGLDFPLHHHISSRSGIYMCSLSMRRGCIWGGGRGCFRIGIMIIICLVCVILSILLGVILWCIHSSQDSFAPEYVWTLEWHKVIRFLGWWGMNILRLFLFGCLMGGLRLKGLCRGRGIWYTRIGLVSLLWRQEVIKLMSLLWSESRTTRRFYLCALF